MAKVNATKPDTSSAGDSDSQGLQHIPMRVQIDMRNRRDYLERMGKDFANYLAWYGDAQRALQEMPADCTLERLNKIVDQLVEDRQHCDVHGLPYPPALRGEWAGTGLTELIAALKANTTPSAAEATDV